VATRTLIPNLAMTKQTLKCTTHKHIRHSSKTFTACLLNIHGAIREFPEWPCESKVCLPAVAFKILSLWSYTLCGTPCEATHFVGQWCHGQKHFLKQFTRYFAVTLSHCLGCQESQQIFVPSKHFGNSKKTAGS
jgi:hypothetical protein